MRFSGRGFAGFGVAAVLCASFVRAGDPRVDPRLGASRVSVVAAIRSEGIQVSLSWDAKGAVVLRKVGQAPVKTDQDLENVLSFVKENYKKEKKPDAVVAIDSVGEVPWRELTKVISICRKAGWKKIEIVVP